MMDLVTTMQSLMSSSAGMIIGLIDYALKGTLILAAALILIVVLRRQSASTRHLILSSAFLGILMLPLCTIIAPAWQISILPDLEVQEQASTGETVFKDNTNHERNNDAAALIENVEGAENEARLDSRSNLALENQEAAKPSNTPSLSHIEASEESWILNSAGFLLGFVKNNWSLLAITVWFGIGIPITIWLIAGMVQISIIVRNAQIPDDKRLPLAMNRVAHETCINFPVRLKLSEQIKYPLAWGVLRPTIVLPIDAQKWTAESIRIVLLHELSHVKRGDILIQCLAHLTLPLFWFNPLVWLASNRLHKEQEQACDDLVLESGIKPSDYALELLEIAGMIKVSVNWAGATMARKSEVKGRIMSILNPDVNRKAVTRLIATVAGIATLLTLLPVASAQIWSKPQAIILPGEPYSPESDQLGQDKQYPRDEPATSESVQSRPVATARSVKVKVFQEGSQLDVDSLIGQLGSSDPEERAYAAFLLGKMKSKAVKAVPALVKLLGDDTEIVVHFEWRVGDSRSIYSGDGTPGHLAGNALGSIGPAAFDAVRPVLSSSNAHARENAVRAMRGIGDRRALEQVRRMVTDKNPEVRIMVIRMMREMKDDGNIEYLAKVVSDAEPEVRILAIRALREFGNAKATEAVFPALKDENVEARSLAVRTLRENMSPAAANALKVLLTDKVLEIRELALRALREYPDSSAVPVIIPLLKDPESSIRMLAVRTLREKQDPASIKPLMEVLSDPDRDIRDLVLRALREFGGTEGAPGVISALSDEDNGIRELAVRTLRELGDQRALQSLSQLHSDPNPEIRELALRALREHNNSAFFDIYIIYLKDKNDSIRELAVRALRELGDKRAVDPLIKILQEDPNKEIRRLAARALSELDL